MGPIGSGSPPPSPAPPLPQSRAVGDGGLGDTGERPLAVRRWLTTIEAATVLGVHRKTLDALAQKFPDAPGGPVVVGGGMRRKHLRWPAAGLEDWLRRVQEAQRQPARPAPKPRRGRAMAMGMEEGPVDWRAVARGR